MRTLRGIVILLLLGILVACNSRETDLEKITTLEKEIFTEDGGMNKEKATELKQLYEKFADRHPSDTLAPATLYKAAELSINLDLGDEAIRLFDRVIQDYPDFYKVPEAYFLKAFVYEISFHSLSKAREAYNEFLEKYPDHDLADDAEASVKNLGKTPEQIIKEAQEAAEKAREDSLASAEGAGSIK